ncbi:MAG: hypothetical protein H6631_12025 [Anaerolineaceae bacterium]|nr:hypothetical protein [Anaerolineaceae bacterium]MCB9099870.1 hypothetical protein [Anaerolineales bacterium]
MSHHHPRKKFNGRLLVLSVDVAIFLLIGALLISRQSPTPEAGPPTIRDVTTNINGDGVARYEKLEITFQVDTVARNLQFPFDRKTPAGLRPGEGITVDALFTPDNWRTVYRQPAFYYQDFEYDLKDDQEWVYPTDELAWKVRFSPNQAGEWQVKLSAEDAGGVSESAPLAFKVIPSHNKGFIKVSQADARYFEFDDGTYFPGLGYNASIGDIQADGAILAENGIQLIRTWLPSQLPMFGAAWSPWRSFGAAPQGSPPGARLRHDASPPFKLTSGVDPPLALPESEVFLWLSPNETTYDDGRQWDFVPCINLGWQAPELPLKPNTNYRIRARYKEEGVTGPKLAGAGYGFALKTGGWLWDNTDERRRCYHPEAGQLLAASYQDTPDWSHYPDPQHAGWQILEGHFNSGDRDFLGYLYLVLENATAGNALVDYLWLEEDLGGNEYGPNVVYRPWMAQHQYFEQRNSFVFDKVVEQAAENNLYLKLVVLEKNDYLLNIFEPDGSLSPDVPEDHSLFYGAGRETNGKSKVRWLQEAWWRYLQARWGYSPHIHSWELLNEGDPNSTGHYLLADEMGKYFHTHFIPAGQAAPHPNTHLVTTSFWHSYPASFWNSEDYPYIDYADIHHYVREGDTQPLDYIYSVEDFYDAALVSQKLSMYYGAKQRNGSGKPLIRGETGFLFDDQDLFAANLSDGLWLHNFLWAGVNAGGMIELYWTGSPTQDHIFSSGSHDHRPMFRSFYNFIKDTPLNNGNYQDAGAISSSPDLRVWGQKDVDHGQAHLWVQNKQHTWKQIADGTSIPAVSGTVTIAGFSPSQPYTVQWWDTYQPDRFQQIIKTETIRSQKDGTVKLLIDELSTDVAIKILEEDN